MKINQAFNIIAKSSDIRTARIIVQHFEKLGFLRTHYIAYQLRRGVPVAKIINQKWFYGLPFYTDKHTLDPRPDTETLVESVILDNYQRPKILDMGTGTGCIICALIKNINGASGVGFDKSLGAIRVAKKNVLKFNLKNKIKIMRGKFNDKLNIGKFDIIVSNPPYIRAGDWRVNRGAMFDPKIALYAKNNGLAAYEQIAESAKNYIKPNGKIYLEIGIAQEKDIIDIFEKQGWTFIAQKPDLSGIIRVLVFKI